ncbi:MAG: SigE family RNA polymerase sigma factor [Acidimicrobiia bacterium]|nr:SigE family RNA polymerase sigma factor [Acidimicrobiia bacterium]
MGRAEAGTAGETSTGAGLFSDFYEREYRPVVEFACVLTGDRWTAEDLAQEAFMAAQSKWAEISSYGSPGAWVRRVVANKSVSRLRKIGAESRALLRLRSRTPQLPPQLSADSIEVWEAVRSLPRRQAQAVALTYLEDLSLQQVGEILECSPFTVKTHLQRGRATLAECLGTEGGTS